MRQPQMDDCLLCGGSSETVSWTWFFKTTAICKKCRIRFKKWEAQSETPLMKSNERFLMKQSGLQLKIHSLYEYDETAQSFMTQFKYQEDWLLAGCFRKEVRQLLQLHKSKAVIVPIPQAERSKRFFNQTEALLNETKMSYEPILMTNSAKRQARKTRINRLTATDEFECIRTCSRTQALLFDDVCTTGATLYRAQRCLLKQGIEVIGACVLFRVKK